MLNVRREPFRTGEDRLGGVAPYQAVASVISLRRSMTLRLRIGSCPRFNPIAPRDYRPHVIPDARDQHHEYVHDHKDHKHGRGDEVDRLKELCRITDPARDNVAPMRREMQAT
jgi:hypothetical protein